MTRQRLIFLLLTWPFVVGNVLALLALEFELVDVTRNTFMAVIASQTGVLAMLFYLGDHATGPIQRARKSEPPATK